MSAAAPSLEQESARETKCQFQTGGSRSVAGTVVRCGSNSFMSCAVGHKGIGVVDAGGGYLQRSSEVFNALRATDNLIDRQ